MTACLWDVLWLQEPAVVPVLPHGVANATLAAALMAGDFHAPESPAPVPKRPAHTVMIMTLLLAACTMRLLCAISSMCASSMPQRLSVISCPALCSACFVEAIAAGA